MPRSGKYYVDLAKKNGLEVRNGKGDHAKIIAPQGRGYMVVPMHHELSSGVEHVIRKWFRALGILLALVVAIITILH